MIKKYESFDNKRDDYGNVTNIGIIGLPSGEYIELKYDIFNLLNEHGILTYNARLRCFTFSDSDYRNIEFYIKGEKKDEKKEKIKRFLSVVGISKYKINSDYTIDTYGSVKIEQPINFIPFKFGYIMGDFDISNCGIIDLRNCPDEVENDFICSRNRLKNLVGGPKKVGGDYDVTLSHLNDLKGSPEKIYGDFICGYNNLADLTDGPKYVVGSYLVDNSLLVSLEGAPKIIGGHFDCSFNLLDDLKGGPISVCGTYNCSNNDIKTIKDGPSVVTKFICKNNPKIKDKHLAPPRCEIIWD